MQAATRRFCLMKPSASVGTRWIVLAVSTLMLVMLALVARADAFVYLANTVQHDRARQPRRQRRQ